MGTIDTIQPCRPQSGPAPYAVFAPKWSGTSRLAARVLMQIDLWAARRRGRIALAQLTEWELHDIGITKSQAGFEAAKPFWVGTQDYR